LKEKKLEFGISLHFKSKEKNMELK